MRLVLVAVGRLKGGAERDLARTYIDRTARTGRAVGLSLDVIELPESRASSADVRRREEAEAIRARLPEAFLVFDERGETPSSTQFADMLGRARERHDAFGLVIGGPDGLDGHLRGDGRAISFGAMTLPHRLMRIVVAEQIYRATTILSGHPYHREG